MLEYKVYRDVAVGVHNQCGEPSIFQADFLFVSDCMHYGLILDNEGAWKIAHIDKDDYDNFSAVWYGSDNWVENKQSAVCEFLEVK